MNYLNTIKTAIIFFPFLALFFTIPYILQQYHKYGSINKLRSLIVYSFILYLLVVYFLVILPLPSIEKVINMDPIKPRLIPFSFINDIIRETSFVLNKPSTYLKSLTDPCVYTVLFNVLMTIPFGMYLRYYFKCDLKKCFKYSFFLSLFFELTQLSGLYFIYPKAYRVFDVDDLITNTLGGIIGYILMGKLKTILPTRDEIDEYSIKIGKNVSGLRRMTLFILDAFLFLILFLFSYLFWQTNYNSYIIFFIYYVFIPYLDDGKTLGGKFLNVKLKFYRWNLFNLMMRSVFLYIYYFGLIFGLIYFGTIIKDFLGFNSLETIYLYFSILFIIFFFYLINVIILIKNKTIYYDKFFDVLFISTIE